MSSGNSIQDQSGVFAPTTTAGQWRLIWQGFRKQRLGMIGLLVLLLMLLVVILGPVFFPNPYASVNPDPTMWNAPIGTVAPMDGHLFVLGSDRLGRDYLALLLKASQFTLLIAFVPSVLILIIGFALGAVAGYFGGWFDTILMQITDFLLTLPLLPACVIVGGLLEITPPFSAVTPDWAKILVSLVIAFTLFGWMGICRMVRALVLSLRAENFVEAAQALGSSTPRVLFRHLLPNTSSALLVAGTLAVGDFAVLETILAYFGLGIYDPADTSIGSLGTLLAACRRDQAGCGKSTRFARFGPVIAPISLQNRR
jgi:peptide/nickel transport system permease protein